MWGILERLLRLVPGREWSLSDRAALQELIGRLAADHAGLCVVYGRSDAGEPWCVVADRDDEVLAHVARIDGRYVIALAEGWFAEGASLRTALRRLFADQAIAPEPAPPAGTPEAEGERQAQLAMALALAALLPLHSTASSDLSDAPDPATTERLASLIRAAADAAGHALPSSGSSLAAWVGAGPEPKPALTVLADERSDSAISAPDAAQLGQGAATPTTHSALTVLARSESHPGARPEAAPDAQDGEAHGVADLPARPELPAFAIEDRIAPARVAPGAAGQAGPAERSQLAANELEQAPQTPGHGLAAPRPGPIANLAPDDSDPADGKSGAKGGSGEKANAMIARNDDAGPWPADSARTDGGADTAHPHHHAQAAPYGSMADAPAVVATVGAPLPSEGDFV